MNVNKAKLQLLFGFKFKENILGEIEFAEVFKKPISEQEAIEIINSYHYFDYKSKTWVSPLTKKFKSDLEKILK